MDAKRYKELKAKGKIEIDPDHDFMPIICDNKKRNGYTCGLWLGEIEVSRPNISKFRCRDCKIVYRYTVNENGLVEWDISDTVVATTKAIAKVRKCH